MAQGKDGLQGRRAQGSLWYAPCQQKCSHSLLEMLNTSNTFLTIRPVATSTSGINYYLHLLHLINVIFPVARGGLSFSFEIKPTQSPVWKCQ